MTTHDHPAALEPVRGEPPEDPEDGLPAGRPPVASRVPAAAGARRGVTALGAGGDGWVVDDVTRLDRATAAHLRDEARRTRARVERHLATAGHLPPASRPDDRVDEARDLSGRLEENVALFEQIDDLHDRRLYSPSGRERQIATRALAEALYRIVDGYTVGDVAPHRPVMAGRRMDQRIGRVAERVAALGPGRQAAIRWWAQDGWWVRLALALVAGVLLALDQVVAAAAVVTGRAGLSVALHTPAAPVGRRQRVLGYDPGWSFCVCTHLGDAVIVAGLGLGLHLGGHTEWGVVTVLAAMFGLIARILRLASGHYGFRLPRQWADRVVMTAALPAVIWASALLAPSGPGTVGGVPVAAALPVVVIVAGTVEIARTLYWAMCRRRLFRRAADAEDGLVPDAIVAHTSDAIVVNLSRIVPRPPVFAADAGERHLRPVHDRQPTHPGGEVDDTDATAEVDATGAGVRPARRGRAGRPTSGRGRRRA